MVVKLHKRRVTFSDKNKIFVMWVWLYAAKKARSNHWEQCAADRLRFKKKIKDVGVKIEWVLSVEHRSSLFSLLYKNDDKTVSCQLDGGKTTLYRKREEVAKFVSDQ
ncbi:hypothetical protein [Psilogramma increta granulovirus]|uniref:Protein DP71L n=1 Tax=Psilogramma increta granulovirus TaxID=2953508 RepID=A0A977TNM6_9BBAC|nr:hypothetical protein [Psilogramma increta granulovirus]